MLSKKAEEFLNTSGHISPTHFPMLAAASTMLKTKNISFSATILVLSGHARHEFQVPKNKEAPEDRLHFSGLDLGIGYFQCHLFHLSDRGLAPISITKNKFHRTACSVTKCLEIKIILTKDV